MSNTKQDPIFADGFILKRNENAPEWVIGSLSIKVDEAIAFLKSNEKKGWVNIETKTGKSGKPYCQLDTWEPNKDAVKKKTVVEAPPQQEETPF